MRHRLLSAAIGATLAFAASLASADVLTFDDIAGSDDYSAVPASYGGLDWSASTWSVLTSPQAPYTAHSGAGRITLAWGSSDGDSVIRFLEPTVFEGAWFAGYSEANVRFDLYSAGRLVASSAAMTMSDTPAFLATGWSSAIDSVVVSSSLHAFYVMDDLSFTPASQVPEPASWALMIAGGVLVAGATRRRGRVDARAAQRSRR